MRCRQTGSSLLEFMVVAGVLAIFAALLLNRLHYYQEVAEKANMEATVKALQSGLRFEMARALMAGLEINYPRMARENPMNWLEPKPSNYRGEFRSNAGELPRGAWYFDTLNRELVYLPALDGYFVPDSEGQVRIRFRVEPLAGKSSVDIVTVQLKAVEAYFWF